MFSDELEKISWEETMDAEEPQAARETAIVPATASASNFFIIA